MLSPIRHLDARRLSQAAARTFGREIEAAVILSLLVVIGLLWLVIGGAVMRGERTSSARPGSSLQGGLADLQAVAGD